VASFPDQLAVHEYAKARGLEYVWEGTQAFEKRLRTLSPEQYQIVTVHTRKGMTRALLFSREIIRAEAKAFDTPARRAKRKARYERLAKARKDGLT
jgi:hypothetical protein